MRKLADQTPAIGATGVSLPYEVRVNPHLEVSREEHEIWACDMGMLRIGPPLSEGVWKADQLRMIAVPELAAKIAPDAKSADLVLSTTRSSGFSPTTTTSPRPSRSVMTGKAVGRTLIGSALSFTQIPGIPFPSRLTQWSEGWPTCGRASRKGGHSAGVETSRGQFTNSSPEPLSSWRTSVMIGCPI